MKKNDVEEDITEIRFVYLTPENYKLHYVNGAYGGITPRGDMLCNFFFEYRSLPKVEKATLRGDRLISTETNESEQEMIRDLKVGVIMTPKEAKNLADWIYSKLKEFEEHFERGDHNEII